MALLLLHMLLIWQANHEAGQFEDDGANVAAVAKAFIEDNIELSTEFLRAAASADLNGTPSAVALDLLGRKHVIAALPEFKKAVESDNELNAEIAASAMGQLGAEGLRALESLLLTLPEEHLYRILSTLSGAGDSDTVLAFQRASNDSGFSAEKRDEFAALSRELKERLLQSRQPSTEPSAN